MLEKLCKLKIEILWQYVIILNNLSFIGLFEKDGISPCFNDFFKL